MRQVIVRHEDWQEIPLVPFLRAHYLNIGGDLAMFGADRAPVGTVDAWIDEGRWLARCPRPGCGGAHVVGDVDPIFWCIYCGSTDNGGSPYGVRFPAVGLRTAIEALLLKRPEPQPFYARTRNWRVGETIEQLRAENAAVGLAD